MQKPLPRQGAVSVIGGLVGNDQTPVGRSPNNKTSHQAPSGARTATRQKLVGNDQRPRTPLGAGSFRMTPIIQIFRARQPGQPSKGGGEKLVA